ncbi:MAG: hypothetical protein LRY71_03650 [Bacillaceae bacterium]|nr:hypothetical protein [Bacillaceae bacterium]
MRDIDNCPRCGKIFVKALRDVCEACFKQEEKDYQTVYNFIRKKENRMSTVSEVEEETGIEERIITKFIRQGRIHISNFPNLAYPCESCGTSIREGRICPACKGNITGGLARLESEKRFEARKRDEENQRVTTYHSLKDKLDKRR